MKIRKPEISPPSRSRTLSLIAARAAARAPPPIRPPFEGRTSAAGVTRVLSFWTFSRRCSPRPRVQNLAMLYQPAGTCLVEGPTGTPGGSKLHGTATAWTVPRGAVPDLPQNAQAWGFDNMGRREGAAAAERRGAPDGRSATAPARAGPSQAGRRPTKSTTGATSSRPPGS